MFLPDFGFPAPGKTKVIMGGDEKWKDVDCAGAWQSPSAGIA
jgi:hypothetical protein